jgi:flotillin
MSKIDKITIVDSGGGTGTGASRISQDISKVLAELPPVVKQLSGVDLIDLINHLPELVKQKATEPSGSDHGSRTE